MHTGSNRMTVYILKMSYEGQPDGAPAAELLFSATSAAHAKKVARVAPRPVTHAELYDGAALRSVSEFKISNRGVTAIRRTVK